MDNKIYLYKCKRCDIWFEAKEEAWAYCPLCRGGVGSINGGVDTDIYEIPNNGNIVVLRLKKEVTGDCCESKKGTK